MGQMNGKLLMNQKAHEKYTNNARLLSMHWDVKYLRQT